MPIADLDIYRTTIMVADRYGDDAVAEAARRSEWLRVVGQAEGATVLRRCDVYWIDVGACGPAGGAAF